MSQEEKTSTSSTPTYTGTQKTILDKLTEIYSPYIGAGTLGGLSDLEQKSLDMLQNANIWGDLQTAGQGLLSGTTGAQTTSSEDAAKAFGSIVETPTMKSWSETWKPEVEEQFSGPGYWGGARAQAVSDKAGDVADWLGTQRAQWMWDTEQSNKEIEEAKAGRALSAMTAVPSGLSQWTGTLFGTGAAAREIENQITDPNVMEVLQLILGTSPAGTTYGETEGSPSQFQQAKNWWNVYQDWQDQVGQAFGTTMGA